MEQTNRVADKPNPSEAKESSSLNLVGLATDRGNDQKIASTTSMNPTDSASKHLQPIKITESAAGPASDATAPAQSYKMGDGLGRQKPNPEIKNYQNALAKLDYLSAQNGKDPADGRFGPATKEAVTKFQKANGLPPTGELDAATQKTLQAPNAVSNPEGSIKVSKSMDWTVPADVSSVNIVLKAGNGGGGGGCGPYWGGDGGIGQKVKKTVDVHPGEVVSISVSAAGPGGDGGAYGGGGGGAGGNVAVKLDGKPLASVLGGGGGAGAPDAAGGSAGYGGDAGNNSWACYGGGGGGGGNGSVEISWTKIQKQ